MRSTIFLVYDQMDLEFVHAIGDRLRTRGFEVDSERWAIGPEDSLVDRVFEEGLKRCAVFAVVVSRNSVTQQWLRGELDLGTVNRIQRHQPFVTLLLDDCIAPPSLGATVVEAVNDRHGFESSASLLADIAYRTIYPEGAPAFDESLPIVEGLTRLQSMLLKETCEYLMEREGETIHPERVFTPERWGWLSEDELTRNVDEVSEQGLLKTFRFLAGGYHFGPTREGFEAYCTTYLPDYQETLKQFASAIINEDLSVNTVIAEKLKKPLRLINHIIDVLEERKMLKTTRFIDSVKVQNASSGLRSLLWFQETPSTKAAPTRPAST